MPYFRRTFYDALHCNAISDSFDRRTDPIFLCTKICFDPVHVWGYFSAFLFLEFVRLSVTDVVDIFHRSCRLSVSLFSFNLLQRGKLNPYPGSVFALLYVTNMSFFIRKFSKIEFVWILKIASLSKPIWISIFI